MIFSEQPTQSRENFRKHYGLILVGCSRGAAMMEEYPFLRLLNGNSCAHNVTMQQQTDACDNLDLTTTLFMPCLFNTKLKLCFRNMLSLLHANLCLEKYQEHYFVT